MFRMSMRQFRKIAARRKSGLRGIVRQVCQVPGGPNRTEASFNSHVLSGRGKFKPKPFLVSKVSRRRYTADFYYEHEGVPVYVEVKGSYRLPSEQRARLAWELAAEQNPGTVFAWARSCGGVWDVEMWYRGGATTVRGACFCMKGFTELLKEVLR